MVAVLLAHKGHLDETGMVCRGFLLEDLIVSTVKALLGLSRWTDRQWSQ